MAAHRPLELGDQPPVIEIANRAEYVGGPRDGQLEDRLDLPTTILNEGGMYRRSVRCAEDGAMRYVWMDDGDGNRRT